MTTTGLNPAGSILVVNLDINCIIVWNVTILGLVEVASVEISYV